MMHQIHQQKEANRAQPHENNILIRPMVAADADLLDAMHQRLSPESVYYRYLQYRKPTLAEIAAVAQLDPAQGQGFVAVAQTEAAIVGLAYYLREAQRKEPTAEPGILIEDHFQEQGIGRRLWHTLQQQAQADGLRWLRVLSHPQNRRLARLVQGGGFPYIANASGGLSEYLVELGQPSTNKAGGWLAKLRGALRMDRLFTIDDLRSWN